MKEIIKRMVEENKEEYVVIGVNFNARIGKNNEEEGENNEEGWNIKRKSKDIMIS